MKVQNLTNAAGEQIIPVTHEAFVFDSDGVRASTKFKNGVFLGELTSDQIPEDIVPPSLTLSEIKDDTVSRTSTWSSQKISEELQNAGGSGGGSINTTVNEPIVVETESTPAVVLKNTAVSKMALVQTADTGEAQLVHTSADDSSDAVVLSLNKDAAQVKDIAKLQHTVGDVTNEYTLYGEHNKPTASDIGADAAGAASAVDTKLSNHTKTTNPHGITAEGIGAQAKITGTKGQVVGFDNSGNPVATEAPAGVKVFYGTIGTTWNEDADTGVKFQQVAISGVLATHVGVTFDVIMTHDRTSDGYALFVEEQNQFLNYITNGDSETVNGGVKFYIYGDPNTVEIPFVLGVV